MDSLLPPAVPKSRKSWRLDEAAADTTVDVESFLRRLADVLLTVDRKASPTPKEDR